MHKITQVVNTEYIQQVLDMAKAGKPFSELAVALTNEEFSVSSFQFSEFFIDIKYLTCHKLSTNFSCLEKYSIRPLSSTSEIWIDDRFFNCIHVLKLFAISAL